jgi:hypothetical protein
MGASIGLAALGRDEMAVLGIFVFFPLVLLARGVTWNRRLLMLGVGGASAAVLVLPWIGYNLSRFDKPVYISSGLGITLASANCDATYYGRTEGYWWGECALRAPQSTQVDESVNSARTESYALKYVRSHEDRLVAVAFARIGRGFGFFRPIQQISFDALIETRPYHWALLGLWMYYGLLVGAVAGTLILRRRRVPVFPLWAVGLDVLLVFVLTFGNTRYRVTFEVALVILTAVAVDAAWSRLSGRRRQGVRVSPANSPDAELAATMPVTA